MSQCLDWIYFLSKLTLDPLRSAINSANKNEIPDYLRFTGKKRLNFEKPD